MLIDDNSKIARLSSTVAGMDNFRLFYSFIWHKILTFKMYLLDSKVGFVDGKNCARICK
jgi:hypothetical protein